MRKRICTIFFNSVKGWCFLRFEEFSGEEGGIVRFCGGSGLERKENGKNAISYAVDACVDLKNITIQ